MAKNSGKRSSVPGCSMLKKHADEKVKRKNNNTNDDYDDEYNNKN